VPVTLPLVNVNVIALNWEEKKICVTVGGNPKSDDISERKIIFAAHCRTIAELNSNFHPLKNV
jgi:hypothetical protein